MKLPNLYKFIVALATSILLSTQTAYASPAQMIVFDDYDSGKAALVGDYSKAIKIAKTKINTKRTYRRMIEATTLCDAYTKSEMFHEAREYCEIAVDSSATAKNTIHDGKLVDNSGNRITMLKIAENNYAAYFSLVFLTKHSIKTAS